jgi:hypothetical protein
LSPKAPSNLNQYIHPQNTVAHKMHFVTIEHRTLIQFFPGIWVRRKTGNVKRRGGKREEG